jgi:hypothetical protein
MINLVKVFSKKPIEVDGKLCFTVVRNYKNGSSKPIGRIYKTVEGAIRQVNHRNACHFDRYGKSTILVKES